METRGHAHHVARMVHAFLINSSNKVAYMLPNSDFLATNQGTRIAFHNTGQTCIILRTSSSSASRRRFFLKKKERRGCRLIASWYFFFFLKLNIL